MAGTEGKKRSRVVGKKDAELNDAESPLNEELMLFYRQKMADNLPTLRAKLRLTQEDLARLLNVSRHTIIGIESHSRIMTWTTYLSLVYVFLRCEDAKNLTVALGLIPVEFDRLLTKQDVM